MNKVVREAEYFKNITHEQIDKKLEFMERAVNGFAAVAEDEQSEDSNEQEDARDDANGQETANDTSRYADEKLSQGAIYNQIGDEEPHENLSIDVSEKQEVEGNEDESE